MTIILAILEQHVFTSFLSQAFIANYEVYSDWIDRFSLECRTCRKRIGFALQWNPGHQLNKITDTTTDNFVCPDEKLIFRL